MAKQHNPRATQSRKHKNRPVVKLPSQPTEPRSRGAEVYPKPISALDAKERIAQEREQHYYFTLHDFEELVRQYGAAKVLQDMGEEIYWMLSKALI